MVCARPALNAPIIVDRVKARSEEDVFEVLRKTSCSVFTVFFERTGG